MKKGQLSTVVKLILMGLVIFAFIGIAMWGYSLYNTFSKQAQYGDSKVSVPRILSFTKVDASTVKVTLRFGYSGDTLKDKVHLFIPYCGGDRHTISPDAFKNSESRKIEFTLATRKLHECGLLVQKEGGGVIADKNSTFGFYTAEDCNCQETPVEQISWVWVDPNNPPESCLDCVRKLDSAGWVAVGAFPKLQKT